MYNYLTEEAIHQFIDRALKEDIGDGDHSSLGAIPALAQSRAKLLVKADGVLAGIELAKRIFARVDPDLRVEQFMQDGQAMKKGDIALHVFGKAQSILQAERLVLNCMQRMCGIATLTSHYTKLIEGTNAKLLDTRKTTPNFRIPEKWAVKIGGGVNHRFGLFDMVMLKDNHVDFAGGIENAIKQVHAYLKEHNLNLDIVLETRNLNEVKEALRVGGISRIMLDNMSNDDMRLAVSLVNGAYPLEASGGINEQTIRGVAETGVDYISVGALTHSARSLDLSLKAF